MIKNNLRMRISVLTLISTLFALNCYSQKIRSEIADKYKWDLSSICKSDTEWRAAKDAIFARLGEIEKFRGTLTISAANLLKCLEFNSEINKEETKLFLYASMNSDLDTRDMKYTGMKQELQQLFSDFGEKAAFIQPEILSADWSVIDNFIKSEPKLDPYRIGLDDIFRTKKHTLSEQEERIMALSGMVGGVPGSVYNTFSNAEMPAPEVTLSDGNKVTLTGTMYGNYRTLPNREDRRIVFEAFYNNLEKFKATYGEMLYGNVQKDIFQAKARHYESSLEAATYPNNIPVGVYHALVDNVNKNLGAFHRYLLIKKRMMGVDTLKYLDLYAPVVKNVRLKYSYDEASKIVLEALKPLGKEYIETVKKAIDEQWIDVYPTPGKQSGAYSNGSLYEGHPYILLNYTENYMDVSTMAHELGHSMQSYLSNKKQPYPLADYQTFVAEVASTFNEVLLFNYMIKNETNDDIKLSLLMNWLDGFKGTLFRQTQFADYELRIHETAEKGLPLTGETLSKMYMDLVKSYYGSDKGICKIDKYIEMEWAYIPHFYYNFYVYQYSTSFTASIALAEKVMSGDTDALKRYIDFLSAGRSDYPIELLKKAGVDMTTADPLEKTIASMNKVMDEIETMLDKKHLVR
jgi:oligoendopeptidase F